jgi:prepilin-type N-terminal cleavage/methylation domain-containing protein
MNSKIQNAFKHLRTTQGFTLIEVAIVTVILGLLIGGTMAGVALLRSSELTAILKEQRQYKSAMEMFRQQYGALPGDMGDAANVWGQSSDCAVPATGTETCNGDSNGLITQGIGEWTRAWQHLALAEYLSADFTGIYNVSLTESNPTSKYKNGLWLIIYEKPGFWDLSFLNGNLFDVPYTNALTIIAENAALNYAIITAHDARALDAKVDDGTPARGKVLSNPNCTTAASAADLTATYKNDGTTVQCFLAFNP